MEPVTNRTTPDLITALNPGEIFVFGSNAQGMHAGGAARFALEHFGAEWGMGEGLQGRSYAIPTMEGLESLKLAVDRFIAFAKQHPEYKFLVTPIGCGIAGYRESQIGPMFVHAADLPNVYLPASFWAVLYHEPNETTMAAVGEAINRKEYPSNELYGSADELFQALDKE